MPPATDWEQAVRDASVGSRGPQTSGPAYQLLFPLGPDTAPYRRLDLPEPQALDLGGRRFLEVPAETLEGLAETAFFDLQHLFRPSHLAQLQGIVLDPESSPADRFVSLELLKNAVIASGRVFPSCQDTGTAIVMAKKGQQVLTSGDPREPLAAGIRRAYARYNLRFSQLAPLTMTEEVDTGTNLPAQLEIEAVPGDAFEFLMIAKGGGSANKTFLYQETRRLLDPERLLAWLEEKVALIGTTAARPTTSPSSWAGSRPSNASRRSSSPRPEHSTRYPKPALPMAGPFATRRSRRACWR